MYSLYSVCIIHRNPRLVTSTSGTYGSTCVCRVSHICVCAHVCVLGLLS